MADWASSASVVMASHSDGSRLDTQMVDFWRCRFDDQLVEVVGLGGVQGAECEVINDEQVHAREAAGLGLEGVVQPGGA